MCSEGVGGIGGNVLVRDQLGVIARAAAIVAPCLGTAAVPRDLLIDPCEKKSKRRKITRWREGVLPGSPGHKYHRLGVSIAYLLLRQRRGEVRTNVQYSLGDAP